jgi:hypothetical protein
MNNLAVILCEEHQNLFHVLPQNQLHKHLIQEMISFTGTYDQTASSRGVLGWGNV